MDLATCKLQVSPNPRPSDSASYLFFHGQRTPGHVLVAEVDGLIAGYLALRPGTRTSSRAHVVEVDGLAMDPGHQGRGVEQQLVEAAVEGSVRDGALKLSLRVLGTNAVARRLYDRRGFVVEGVLRAEYLLEGRYVDDMLMARHLVGCGGGRRAA